MFFQYAGRFLQVILEKTPAGLPRGLIRAQSGCVFFSMRGVFSVCGTPVTCFSVTRETGVLEKNARRVPVGINSSPIRVRFFQYARAFFPVILEKNGLRPAGQLINDRIGTVFFQVERFFPVILEKVLICI